MEREVGGGIGMGNTCKPMADSFQCMTKSTTIKKLKKKKQQLEPYVEQQTGSKLGKEYDKVVYCHPINLTSMQSTSCKMPGWVNHNLESRLPGEISTTSDVQMISP